MSSFPGGYNFYLKHQQNEASRFQIYHVVHHVSSACYSNKDVMISLLQQWLNHSAPNLKPQTCHSEEVTHRPPSPWRNFKPSTYITVVSPNNAPKRPELCLLITKAYLGASGLENSPKRWHDLPKCFLENWILFFLPHYNISPTWIFLK